METPTASPHQTMDITIQKGDALPEIKKCTDCCSYFHCPFCSPKSYLPTNKSRVLVHLKMHFNRAVQYADYTIHRCGRTCRTMAHYHCPFCETTVMRKEDFLRHLQNCDVKDKSDSTAQAPPADDDVSNLNDTSPDSGNRSSEKLTKTKPNQRQKCPECHLTFFKKNLEKHIKLRHYTKLKDNSSVHSSHISPNNENENGEAQGLTPNSISFQMDITIQKGDSLPEIKKCTDCCSNFHCPFCSPKSFSPCKESRVKAHLKTHFNRSVQHAGYTIHRCGRTCRNLAHFHCPYCRTTVLRKEDFQKHLSNCDREDKSDTSVQTPLAIEPKVSTPDQRQQCPKCRLTFFRKNLLKHIERRHTARENDCTPSPFKRKLNPTVSNEDGGEKQSMDITVQRGDSLPEIKRCTDCCSNFHCPFCSTTSFRPSKVSRVKFHLKRHFNRAVQYAGYTIHRCGRICRGQPHFHCPFCNNTVLRKTDFLQHLDACKGKADPAIQALLAAEGTPEQNTTTPKRIKSKIRKPLLRQKCPSCHLAFYKKNLKRHIERRHSLENSPYSHLNSECVDPQNGVYAVHQIVRGVSRPLHVQIRMQGDQEYVSCEFSLCQAKMELAQKTGLLTYKCIHLQSVLNCRTFLSSPTLTERTLTEIVKRRLFRKSRKKMCTDRQIQALQQNAPLSVQSEIGVPPSKKYISVFEPNLSHFSRLHRVMVSYNTQKNMWYCPCSRTRKSCTHKYIAKWHLYQIDPDLFTKVAPRPKTGPPKAKRQKTKSRVDQKAEIEFASAQQPQIDFQETEAEVQSDTEDTAMEILETIATAMETNVSVVTYPPKEVQMIKNMVHYLLVNKKLPSVPPEHITLPSAEKDYPQHLVPAETYCLYCADAIALSQPILITHKAKILTNCRAVQDVSTYYKFCPRCGVPYRYQEWGDGLHNFNDHLLLDLPLCLSIRSMLQAQNGFGQIVEYLKSSVGAAFPSADTLLGAYLHFEALTDHQHQYSCVTWGERPPVVVMELQNKAFNFSGRDLAGPAAALSGPGDMDHLWKALTEERIARGLVSSTKKSVLYKIL